MPKNPADILAAAAKINGLDSPEAKPWHIKIAYQVFDGEGKVGHTGTFEEWWAGPKKDKRVYTSSTFNRTEYVTEAGTFRVGDEVGPPLAESLVRQRLVSPMPGSEDTDNAELQRRDNPFPNTKLTCIELVRKIDHQLGPSPVGLFPLYCFDPSAPMLRFSGSFGLLNTLYKKVGMLGGRYLGTDVSISDTGKPFVDFHLAEGNLMTTVDESIFAPPANAIALPEQSVTVEGKVLAGRKLNGSAPRYPAAAKSARISGTVILSALIGEDGRIHELRIKSAPDVSLALSAIEAVRDWTYAPYTLNGHPVEVSTEIRVMYRLSGG
ncbi:TonB family protein [Silvibacterium bohemicum]|uniref:TonB family protein n=1 Tax=Silvibacterium bohemicum TaxID=1577686 RepID=A0A841K0X9_9BACT|nr:energy transducer TonB [Silvibacterium bohemicum]MBB6145609.1 TonB family protein [Silvibacterium bohemicum]